MNASIAARTCALLALSAAVLTPAAAQQVVDLCEPEQKNLGWSFDNGREFPGATGSLTVEPGQAAGDPPALKLVGDFTKGGGYVQAGRKLKAVDMTALSLEIEDPQDDLLRMRLIDSGGQCHQIKYRIDRAKGWRRVRFPLGEFFDNKGRADAVTGIEQYQHWGGDNDGKWRGPATGVYLLITPVGDQKLRTVRLRRIQATVPAKEAVAPLPVGPGGAVKLLEPGKETLGWAFENGPEFPGASGTLAADAGAGAPPTLKLVGDFTKGGGYVQAGRKLPDLEVVSLSLEVKDPDQDLFKFRITDATDQCHQIRYRVGMAKGWQRIEFPVRRFFEMKGQAGGVTNVVRYEHWGGANDGRWHGPAKELEILVSAADAIKVRTVWLRDICATVAPRAEQAMLRKWMRLDEGGPEEWKVGLGWEFKGAKATLETVKDMPAKGESCLKLAADFTEGGRYVEAQRPMTGLGISDIASIRFRARTEGTGRLRLRLVDDTKQTHQTRSMLRVEPDGKWHDMAIEVSDVAGSESWGGAKDGKWHGPPQLLTFLLPLQAEATTKRIALYLADVEVEALVPAEAQAAAFEEKFESAGLPAGWTRRGDVSLDDARPFEGKRSLRLSRTQETVNDPVDVTAPKFPVRQGQWQLGAAVRADLHSPDNSYKAAVALECLDAAGRVVERVALAEIYGTKDWQAVRKSVTVPKGAAAARFSVRLEKAWGSFWLDDLSAAHLAAAAKKDDRIVRALLSTGRPGNLLMPGDKPVVDLVLEARRALMPEQQQVQYVVRDYWGAEQAKPATAELALAEKAKDGTHRYKAALDLAAAPIEVGRYYEVHIRIAGKDVGPFTDYTTLAVLPEAPAKKHRWQDIPFTSRNWDNRVPAYFELSDRLGIRICGLWSGWQPNPPYKVAAPRWEDIETFDMGAVMRTQGNTIERHLKNYEQYTGKVLREGAAAMVREYNKDGRIAAVCLGNEPHGKGDKVLEDVQAYKAMYEGAKEADPKVLVLGTSVGPEEEYFKAGIGQYCDVYDFHTYGSADGIRRLFGRYRELFRKYGHEKPIWSTELGLNSEGMTRQDVAAGLIRSFSTFFACGGQSCSWFAIVYPDPQGKMAGGAGQSHNVFFCRYNRYSPKMDAIAYYNMVNGICVKKFVAERMYDNVRAILFRDAQGQCLQVLWNEGQARDALVPLKEVGKVALVRIDGGLAALDAGGTGLTLRLARDPILLLYEDAKGQLPEKLGAPQAALAAPPPEIARGGKAVVAVALAGDPVPAAALQAPPFWRVGPPKAGADEAGRRLVRFEVTAPAETAARAGSVRVILRHGEQVAGELDFRLPVTAGGAD